MCVCARVCTISLCYFLYAVTEPLKNKLWTVFSLLHFKLAVIEEIPGIFG